jgi:spore photoproduct lyase
MVLYEGCEEAYREVVAEIVSRVPPERIVWVSLGTFRFMPALKPIIQRRFPESKIVYGEFITGLDGKMRYFKPLRIALYRKMAAWFRELAPGVTVYLCMEDDEIWRKTFGFIPEDRGGLPRMLDDAAARHCGVRP